MLWNRVGRKWWFRPIYRKRHSIFLICWVGMRSLLNFARRRMGRARVWWRKAFRVRWVIRVLLRIMIRLGGISDLWTILHFFRTWILPSSRLRHRCRRFYWTGRLILRARHDCCRRWGSRWWRLRSSQGVQAINISTKFTMRNWILANWSIRMEWAAGGILKWRETWIWPLWLPIFGNKHFRKGLETN